MNSRWGKAAVSVCLPPQTPGLRPRRQAPTSVADTDEQMDGQAARGFISLFPVASAPGKWSQEAEMPPRCEVPPGSSAPVLERRLREGGPLPKVTQHTRGPQGLTAGVGPLH